MLKRGSSSRSQPGGTTVLPKHNTCYDHPTPTEKMSADPTLTGCQGAVYTTSGHPAEKYCYDERSKTQHKYVSQGHLDWYKKCCTWNFMHSGACLPREVKDGPAEFTEPMGIRTFVEVA